VRAWWRELREALASLRAVYRLDRQLTRGDKSGPEVLAELDAMEAEELAVLEARRRLRSAGSGHP
jgi:hypothetical protein